MSDGLEWLICDEPCKVMDARSGCHCAKARDEITRLRAEVERKDAALRKIDAVPAVQMLTEFGSIKEMQRIARAALNPPQEPRT